MSNNYGQISSFIWNVCDDVLRGLIDDSLDFYKKLTEPKRNDYVKRILFDNYSEEM